jgi:hypothetical protein
MSRYFSVSKAIDSFAFNSCTVWEIRLLTPLIGKEKVNNCQYKLASNQNWGCLHYILENIAS